jgi:predicted methyltransferase
MFRARSPAVLLLVWLAAAALSVPAWGQHASHQVDFSDTRKWSRVLDHPLRDEWQKPAQVVQALGLKPTSRVADIGSGTGYFAVRLARLVPQGRVYGVDTEPAMVKFLAERAKREGLDNLTSIEGKPGDPKLPGAVDVMLMVDVYHHIADRVGYLRAVRSCLEPGGRLAIIDHVDTPGSVLKDEQTAPRRIKAELKRAGYRLAAEHSFLPEQYFLIFKPATR